MLDGRTMTFGDDGTPTAEQADGDDERWGVA